MAVYAAPDLTLVGFRIGLTYPGQNVISSRLTGKIDTVNRGPGLWTGNAVWHIDPHTRRDTSEVMRWISQLRGQTNQTQIDLPASHKAATAPSSDFAATIGTSVLTTAGEAEVTLTVSAGSWTITLGDLLTIGDRLYCIEGIDGSTYSLAPRRKPEVGAVVRAAAPYVIVTAVDPEQLAMAYEGPQFERLAFDWIEHQD